MSSTNSPLPDLSKSKNSKSDLNNFFKSEKSTSGQNVPDTKTPEKPRVRTRGMIMNLKELRQVAKSLQKPDPDSSVPITRTDTQKIKSSPFKRMSDSPVKLPDKYEILDDFFNGLDSAIRLLQLKGSATTFGNIIPKVECLTDRRFTYTHLAQMKFILPEAFEIKKVLVRDERTSCMKPDLHIVLNVNSIEQKEKRKSVEGNGMLRKVFRARLVDFVNAHPEGDEVPAESLPKPFDEPRQHMPIRRQEVPAAHVSEGRLNLTNSVPQATLTVMPTLKRVSPVLKTCTSASLSPSKYSVILPSNPLIETPSKDINLGKGEDFVFSPSTSTQGTPARLVSTPAKLMTATPSLQPPKRCSMTPDSFQSPVKLVRRPPRSRSLKFDTNEGDVDNGHSTIDADTLDVLPQDLLDSIREKERKVLIENDPAISQAKWRRKMIAKLPKFFDMVYFLFQSIKRSVITKEELVHKILSNNLDIIDKREVEDHLALLKELVPDWIYEKSASSGDLLFCINKVHSPQSIHSRIAEAT